MGTCLRTPRCFQTPNHLDESGLTPIGRNARLVRKDRGARRSESPGGGTQRNCQSHSSKTFFARLRWRRLVSQWSQPSKSN